jgi:Response regulator containing a CheY-like receiver domain and an HTH DNA-binding domain
MPLTSTATISVLLVDDHAIIRDGIKALLDTVPGIDVVGEADNGQEALSWLEQHACTIVLLDIKMPEKSGIETAQLIHRHFPDVKVLALTMFLEEEYIAQMLQAGAQGYILKKTGKAELEQALRTVAEGSTYFSQEVTSKMMNRLLNPKPAATAETKAGTGNLTKRELEILRMIADQMTNNEIAEQLCISSRTVDTHRRNLLQKLGVKNTAGLVKYVYENNLHKEV